ncbi:MAG: hypothetical protein J6328_01910, partial [Bacilli bacterium]|nr:hypothetical protein [Bacilli bacterium]
DAKKALDILLSNRDVLWEKNPLLLMKTNFEIRFALKEFDEAYEDMKDFENRPYVSQEVEEVLRGLPNYIRANERNTFHHEKLDEAEIREKLLNTNDDFTLLQLLGKIESNPLDYIQEIRSIASSDRNEQLKTFALLLLTQAKDGEKLVFKKNGESFELTPKDLEKPFVNDRYKKTLSFIEGGSKNTSIIQAAKSLFDNLVLAIYPKQVEEKEKLVAASFLLLAAKYLNSSAELILSGVEEEEAKKLSARFEGEIEKAESISM